MNQDTRKERRREVLEHVGDLLENRIGSSIENSALEAPVLDPEETVRPKVQSVGQEGRAGSIPAKRVWYRVPVRKGLSGDGSEYHIYLKAGDTQHLCVFFSGGGMAWNTYTAARPASGGKMAAKTPNYYWNNLRPATQIMNINVGITDVLLGTNPFQQWNMAVITYDTGDFHIGDSELPYESEDGEGKILHFHGYRNFQAAMEICRDFFPEPDQLLIAGDSAGAFAVPALAGDILEEWYPDCKDVTLLSDSATLIYDGWQSIIRDVWRAPEKFWKPIKTDDPAGDWYEALAEKLPADKTIRCLYSSSTHDHLLSTYYNDLVNRKYETNEEMQERYYMQLSGQMRRFKTIFENFRTEEGKPVFGMYIHQHKDLLRSRTGTVHTMVRHPAFLIPERSGMSMAKWLSDAVNGNVYDVGEQLLKQEEGK